MAATAGKFQDQFGILFIIFEVKRPFVIPRAMKPNVYHVSSVQVNLHTVWRRSSPYTTHTLPLFVAFKADGLAAVGELLLPDRSFACDLGAALRRPTNPQGPRREAMGDASVGDGGEKAFVTYNISIYKHQGGSVQIPNAINARRASNALGHASSMEP